MNSAQNVLTHLCQWQHLIG